MNIIIFSKDRPLQLYALLESMILNIEDLKKFTVSIIYTFSKEEYSNGYRKVKEKFKNFKYVLQTNFKEDILLNLNDKEFIMFLVDDIVFTNKFSLNCKEFEEFKNNKDIACLSLRLGKNTKFCYTLNKSMKIPEFIKQDPLIWNWKNEECDWQYPMSLDGHIFKVKDLLFNLQNLSYSNPNQLEGKLAFKPIQKFFMICFKRSILFNNPCNRVQNFSNNLYGQQFNYNQAELNKKFLDNYKIDIVVFQNINTNSPHQEFELKLIKEGIDNEK